VAREDVRPRVGRVLAGVDAVVDDVHPVGVHVRVAREHVPAHAARDRDDRVGVLERGALAEARQRVAAPELLGLPRAQRLEGVGADDVGDPVEELAQVAAEIRVPGVAVDDVGALDRGRHRQVDRHGAQRGEVGGPAVERVPGGVAHDRGAVGLGPGALAPALDRDALELRQLAGEVLDVDAGATVDLGRVLAREEVHAHVRPPPGRPWGSPRPRRPRP
jgi:hypothetical protein